MKKVVFLALSLMLILGLIACGSAESKAASKAIEAMKAYSDVAKTVIAQYQAAKSADELNAANEAAIKLKEDFKKAAKELEEEFSDVDFDKLSSENQDFKNAISERRKADRELDDASDEAEARLSED